MESDSHDLQNNFQVDYGIHGERETLTRVEETIMEYLHDFGDTGELSKQTHKKNHRKILVPLATLKLKPSVQ